MNTALLPQNPVGIRSDYRIYGLPCAQLVYGEDVMSLVLYPDEARPAIRDNFGNDIEVVFEESEVCDCCLQDVCDCTGEPFAVGDGELPVTDERPGAACDNPLRFTTAEEIQAQARPHRCTCTFAGGEIAVVQVYGAPDQEHAHSYVQYLWYPVPYSVVDGDTTNGYARPFTLILPLAKRNPARLRFPASSQEDERRQEWRSLSSPPLRVARSSTIEKRKKGMQSLSATTLGEAKQRLRQAEADLAARRRRQRAISLGGDVGAIQREIDQLETHIAALRLAISVMEQDG